MSDKRRVPFPRYLNAKKLFYKWEQDVVFAAAVSFVVCFIVQIWLSVTILLAIFTSLVVSFFVMKRYIKYFKKTRKGFISNLGYSKGYKEPFDKTKIKKPFEEHILPRGFENEFID